MTWRRRLGVESEVSFICRSSVRQQYIPTALSSMMPCALALAAMIVFGLAGRAELKIERTRLRILAVCSGVDVVSEMFA